MIKNKMTSFIPNELMYTPEPRPEPVVLSRQEAYLTSPTAVHSPSGANVIRFHITTSNFVDLSSVAMFADLLGVITSPGGQTGVAGDGVKVLVNGTSSIFSSMVVESGGGTVMEEIRNGVQLGQMLHNISSSDDYLESTGGFSNDNLPFNRDPLAAASNYKIAQIHQLGFFSNSHKYIRPSDFGGIVLTCTLANDAQLATVRNAADSYAFSMQNVKLYYDELQVSEAYRNFYSDQYLKKGLRFTFDTFSSTSASITSGANQVVPVSLQAKRAKALYSILQTKANVSNKLYPSDRFISAGMNSFAYEVSGTRYPPSSVESYPRAWEEVLKSNYAKHDCQRPTLTTSQYSSDWLADAGADKSSLSYGKFVAVLDGEKYSSTDASGMVLTPNGTNFLVDWAGIAAETQVTTYCLHTRAVTLVDGQISVTY